MVGLPALVALAIVALIGYSVGRFGRSDQDELIRRSRGELRRAQLVAEELERIASQVRQNLQHHRTSLGRFKEHVSKLSQEEQPAAWNTLCTEAEEILRPTLHLANQMADAYEQIRQQSAHLMTFTETRTDPLTCVNNRRALSELVTMQFALMRRYGATFSVALFDIDHFKKVNDEQGHLKGDEILREVARVCDETVRETDTLARYGGEEFVIVMPQTDLAGAVLVAERVRELVQQQTVVTISSGVTAARDGDTLETLLGRADAALYNAKSAGRNCVHCSLDDPSENKPAQAVLGTK